MTVAELKAAMCKKNPNRDKWNDRWTDLWEQLSYYPDDMAVTRWSKVFNGSGPMWLDEHENRSRAWLRIVGPDVFIYSA